MNIWKFYPWIFLALIVVFIGLNLVYQLYAPRFIPAPGIDTEVQRRSFLRAVTNELERAGVIRSAFALRFYLHVTNTARQVKPGLYHFEGRLTIPEIARILTHGGKEIEITIPEGMTVYDIETIFAAQGLPIIFSEFQLEDFSQEVEFVKFFLPKNKNGSGSTTYAAVNLEGFLFPDSYRFFRDETAQEVALKFLKNFGVKAMPEFLNTGHNKHYETLIIASLLEAEVKTYEEKTLVAGIIQRRLAQGAKLQIDATAAYARCLGQVSDAGYRVLANKQGKTVNQMKPEAKNSSDCSRTVTKKDLEIDSPYNTYKVVGSPPAPINNPGVESIRAALNPRASDFLYYLTTPEGKTIFSKTLREHNANVKKYLKSN